jgi:hypothetical protein
MLTCPKCYNDHLLIRRRNGLEKVMIYLTAKRKYVCMSCAHAFRAPDRRSAKREDPDAALSQATLRG